MADALDLARLVSGGQKLARIDDVDYLEVSVILACPSEGQTAIYCQRADWPTTPAARLAERDRQIQELGQALSLQASEALKQAQRAKAAERRVAELEQQLVDESPPRETPLQNQERMLQQQAAALDASVGCPDCPASFKNERALRMHQQRAHQGMKTIKAPPIQFVEELGWHCAAKGCAGAHARDMHDPLFCTLHAQRQIANGMEVAK